MRLIINNRLIVASAGETVYQAAKKAGMIIPSLCVSEHLAPFGSCRLCLCEVEGQSGTPASCTTPAREGMVVRTESERLDRHLRNIIRAYALVDDTTDLDTLTEQELTEIIVDAVQPA